MPKNAQTTRTIALISYASKVMLKILQARLQKFVNQSSPAFTPTWHPKSVSGFWAGPACRKKKKKLWTKNF